MRNALRAADRVAGRIYTRILAVATGIVSAGMLILAVIFWALGDPTSGWIWFTGAVVFGIIARSCWRSRAAISDIDFTT